MAASVQILCPNGRRQNVKVTANTKLLQVLEEVCTKQGFLPSDDYDLIHGRKALDLTLAFRFSNLANNAKLELVKSASPRSQSQGEVTIALQLESGERLQHTFQPSVSLWQILQHWEKQDPKHKGKLMCVDGSQSPPIHPVCIYMREEVIGETALQDMTLKKLALTSGKAIIRLVHRPVDDLALAEVISKIEQEKAKQARLAQKASGSSLPVSTSVSQHSTPIDTPSTEEIMEVDKPLPASLQESVRVEEVKAVKTTEAEPMDTQENKAQITRFLRQSARDDQNTPTYSHASSVDRHSEGACASGSSEIDQLRSMNIPGVEIITPGDFDNLSPEEQQMARRLMEQFIPATMGRQQQSASRPKKPKAPQQQFADFKFPEETKGKNLYQNELSEVNSEEFMPCDREVVIYNSNEENTSKALAEEPPEDFFEVTEADVRSLYKDRQRQVASERPLMTESMRQMELEDKYQQYHHVVVRVQFPDGMVLQGCFRPRETVYALNKFVREHLEDRRQEFHLYRTPPKQILTDTAKTLVQADLAPASLVFFSSVSTEEHSLSAAAMSEVSSKRRADELSVKKLARKQIENLATVGSSSDSPKSSCASSSSSVNAERNTDTASRPAQKTASTASSEAKVPKWLKIGKK
ncbi:tether containing UBX domain for GLUT4-like [Babylonia areolata]|uniref:tether containing UBX domain for GLUT4-like n=1 Tax=Babylonia areolata TaxID=304850 RepID=UPI003FD3FCB2